MCEHYIDSATSSVSEFRINICQFSASDVNYKTTDSGKEIQFQQDPKTQIFHSW